MGRARWTGQNVGHVEQREVGSWPTCQCQGTGSGVSFPLLLPCHLAHVPLSLENLRSLPAELGPHVLHMATIRRVTGDSRCCLACASSHTCSPGPSAGPVSHTHIPRVHAHYCHVRPLIQGRRVSVSI